MTTWSLLDNALNSISFFGDWGGKPEWYDEVKEKNDSWERAWDGSFFSIKCNEIWVTFKEKR